MRMKLISRKKQFVLYIKDFDMDFFRDLIELIIRNIFFYRLKVLTDVHGHCLDYLEEQKIFN